jgi:2-dehydropantoate 2-reductase
MKILILGAGAIGGYYGARLIEAGADVTFLVRPQRQALIAQQGLIVDSELGAFSHSIKTVVAADLRIGQPAFDLVLLTCKTYDLPQAMDAIAPAMQAGTKILPFLNGIQAYDALDARFGKDNVIGGVAYIATMLTPQGGIVHMGKNDVVLVGARSAATQATAEAFYRLIAQSAGVRKLHDDIEQALWDKWVMITAGAAMCCLMRGAIKDILHTQDGRTLIEQAIRECMSVAQHAGHPLAPATVATMRGLLLDDASPWAASMMRDIRQNAPRLEADGVVGDMLARAAQFGSDAALLRAAYCHLQIYMEQNRPQ